MDQSRSREVNFPHTIKKSLDILLTPLQESAISSCPELDEPVATFIQFLNSTLILI